MTKVNSHFFVFNYLAMLCLVGTFHLLAFNAQINETNHAKDVSKSDIGLLNNILTNNKNTNLRNSPFNVLGDNPNNEIRRFVPASSDFITPTYFISNKFAAQYLWQSLQHDFDPIDIGNLNLSSFKFKSATIHEYVLLDNRDYLFFNRYADFYKINELTFLDFETNYFQDSITIDDNESLCFKKSKVLPSAITINKAIQLRLANIKFKAQISKYTFYKLALAVSHGTVAVCDNPTDKSHQKIACSPALLSEYTMINFISEQDRIALTVLSFNGVMI